jgi:hypothetical protein
MESAPCWGSSLAVACGFSRHLGLVIGGYVPGAHGVESIIVGYYKESELIYGGTGAEWVCPATRRQVFVRLRPRVVADCLFANLPEIEKGRRGTGLAAEDMKRCIWVRPEVVARIEYLE